MTRRILVGALAPLLLAALSWGLGSALAQGTTKAKPSTAKPKEESGTDDKKARKPSNRKGDAKAPTGPADYTSKNFLIHTDLPPDEAKELLGRLEIMLGNISRYWGRPIRQTIECYVIKDLANWPDGSLDPNGVRMVRAGGGVTLGTVQSIAGQPVAAKAPVYAIADRGTPQHEAVHAYCILTFGTSGPVWYSEGMAEMGQYWKDGEVAVNCHDIVSDYLRGSEPKSLDEIVNGQERTGDSWQNYAWRWALCHLLAHNPNYAARFRPLGMDLLQKKPTSFEDVYGSMAKEILFEYDFFLKHVEPGFRVDLCAWDWKVRYRQPKGTLTATSTIEAGRGWQPTRALVEEGKEYQYSAAGRWKLQKEATEIDADGDGEGNGRLVGVLFDDYKLSDEFELGAYGTFKAPGDGQLLVRCRQDWTDIANASGKLTVKIMAGDSGRTLPNPKDKPRD